MDVVRGDDGNPGVRTHSQCVSNWWVCGKDVSCGMPEEVEGQSALKIAAGGGIQRSVAHYGRCVKGGIRQEGVAPNHTQVQPVSNLDLLAKPYGFLGGPTAGHPSSWVPLRVL